MRKAIVAAIASLISGVALASSPTAVVTTADGSVLVNHGKQFVTVEPKHILAVGDRVMVMEGGNAVLTYSDGCVQTLNSGSLALIDVQSSCAAEKSNVTRIRPVSAQAIGDQADCDGDSILDSQDDDIDGDGVLNPNDANITCRTNSGLRSNTGIWIAAGVAGAAIIYAISDGDDETISP